MAKSPELLDQETFEDAVRDLLQPRDGAEYRLVSLGCPQPTEAAKADCERIFLVTLRVTTPKGGADYLVLLVFERTTLLAAPGLAGLTTWALDGAPLNGGFQRIASIGFTRPESAGVWFTRWSGN